MICFSEQCFWSFSSHSRRIASFVACPRDKIGRPQGKDSFFRLLTFLLCINPILAKMRTIIIFILVTQLFTQPLRAQDSASPSPRPDETTVQVTETQVSPGFIKKTLDYIIDPEVAATAIQLKSALESDSADSTGWRARILTLASVWNLKRLATNVYRIYVFNQHSAQDNNKVLRSLITILPFTEMTEQVLFGSSAAKEFWSLQTLIAAGIVRFDLICIAGIAAVSTSRCLRTALSKAGETVAGTAGFLVDAYTTSTDRNRMILDFLTSLPEGSYHLAEETAGPNQNRLTVDLTSPDGASIAQLSWIRNDRTWLEGITVYTRQIDLLRKHPILKVLGWNARDVIRNSIKRIKKNRTHRLKDIFYIRSVTETPGQIQIGFKPHSILMNDAREFAPNFGNCEGLIDVR